MLRVLQQIDVILRKQENISSYLVEQYSTFDWKLNKFAVEIQNFNSYIWSKVTYLPKRWKFKTSTRLFIKFASNLRYEECFIQPRLWKILSFHYLDYSAVVLSPKASQELPNQSWTGICSHHLQKLAPNPAKTKAQLITEITNYLQLTNRYWPFARRLILIDSFVTRKRIIHFL